MNDSTWLEAVLYYVYISRVDRVDTFLVLLNFAKGFYESSFCVKTRGVHIYLQVKKIRPNLIALIFLKGQIVSITFIYISIFLEEIYISIDVISHNKLGTKARLTCREKKKVTQKRVLFLLFFFGPERPIV